MQQFRNGIGVDLDIRSFLDKEYDLELHAELDLPDVLQLGNYQIDLTLGQGCLFEDDYVELAHGDGTSKDWYVFFAEEDSQYVYMLFLNQEYFDKKDIVELARSMKFKVK